MCVKLPPMQTFLPYVDFKTTAKVLDYRRLGKQRVECVQILRALTGQTTAWANHPAVKMWEGHTDTLKQYAAVICMEWINRGYRDNCLQHVANYNPDAPAPWWLGHEPFHASHRANLLRKLPEHYRRFGWIEDPATPYFWPSKCEGASPLDKG